MYKILILLTIVLCSNAFALSDCGESTEDRKYPHLDWVKATDYRVNSTYIDIKGILCAGVSRISNTLSRIHYRDDSGVVVKATKKELMEKDVVFLRQSDFPAVARMVTRRDDPLTIKVQSEVRKKDSTDYVLNLKFVRNMGRSFYQTDLRLLVINAQINQNGKHLIYFGDVPSSNSLFDLVSLSVGADLKVKKIDFFDGQQRLQSIQTHSLQKTKR